MVSAWAYSASCTAIERQDHDRSLPELQVGDRRWPPAGQHDEPVEGAGRSPSAGTTTMRSTCSGTTSIPSGASVRAVGGKVGVPRRRGA